MTGPLFSGGRPPKFLEYKGEAILELPENLTDFEKDAQASIEEQMTNSVMLCLYEKHTAQRNPILYKMFKYSEGLTLTTPIQYSGSTWDGDVLTLRESLIRVQKYGNILPCVESTIPTDPKKMGSLRPARKMPARFLSGGDLQAP